jgi:hypothetical protein
VAKFGGQVVRLAADQSGWPSGLRQFGTAAGGALGGTNLGGQDLERRGLQAVADENGRGLVELLMAGGPAAAKIIVVHRRQVVVH